jgi:hypothetical protein
MSSMILINDAEFVSCKTWIFERILVSVARVLWDENRSFAEILIRKANSHYELLCFESVVNGEYLGGQLPAFCNAITKMKDETALLWTEGLEEEDKGMLLGILDDVQAMMVKHGPIQ